ncbi:uncharacterized protein LOC143179536 [Calliopsis andreniformis]|uniref:uncharacterized protein LOC143179536 n=1 Tax=Calliopsis andreniformis TaxID=337506 RepID=UPI003FCCAEAE
MLPRRALLILFCCVIGALSLPATYDQRQTGDLNVQVHLKDVQVLALLNADLTNDYTEYDYIYDYGDFTVKPIKPTSSAPSWTPSATTEKIDVTETINPSSQNSTLDTAISEALAINSTTENLENISISDGGKMNETSPDMVTEKLEDLSSESSTVKMRINDKTRKVLEDNETLVQRNTGGVPMENVTTRMIRKRCRSGYSPNGKNRCWRLSQRRLSFIPSDFILQINLAPRKEFGAGCLSDAIKLKILQICKKKCNKVKEPRYTRGMVDHSRSLIIYVDRWSLYVRCYPLQWRCSLDLYTRAQPIHESGSPAVEDQTSFDLADPGFYNMVIHDERLLLPGILLGLLIQYSNAAPTTYHQTQVGNFNVDTKLDNFLIVIGEALSSNLLNKLATKALQLQSLPSQRSVSEGTSEKPLEATVYETDDAKGGREPYHVEIVHIGKEGESALEKSKASEKPEIPSGNTENKIENDKSSNLEGASVVSIDGSKPDKKVRSLLGSEEHFEVVYDSTKKSKQLISMKNFDQSDLEVKEESFKTTRPGISLKKQLSKEQEEENRVLTSAERNDLGKFHELVLVGDGIENCGPGRYRDRKGICQHDQSFN